jgi:hypothetical protein
MKKKITPKKIRKALIKGHRAIEKQREGTHLMLETIKLRKNWRSFWRTRR